MRNNLDSTFSIVATGWADNEPRYKESEKGWENAIQEYLNTARATNFRCNNSYYQMDFTYKVEDYYYWMDKENWGVRVAGVLILSDKELRDMHLFGAMKMFRVHGRDYTVKVRWKKGKRIGIDSEATYE